MEGVDVLLREDGLMVSKPHPDRAVKELLWGFAIYQRQDGEGVRLGCGDQEAAFRWLSGGPAEGPGFFKVGVNDEPQEKP